jgi:N-carbamoylputrescine amidase
VSGSALNVAICQLPDGLSHDGLPWTRFVQRIERTKPDVVLLNEMPFGPWTSREAVFDEYLAAESIGAHASALEALRALPCATIASRPVRTRDQLANEGFLLADGQYRAVHQKQYFPQEPGFFESAWFTANRAGFETFDYGGMRFGMLLCTELMFNEWARHYRRRGAHVIVVPRASGSSVAVWHVAARMAAIVSGCYVLSSNRVSSRFDEHASLDPLFGGAGFAYSPTGELLHETSAELPCAVVRIEPDRVLSAQRNYPCYVRELGEAAQ